MDKVPYFVRVGVPFRKNSPGDASRARLTRMWHCIRTKTIISSTISHRISRTHSASMYMYCTCTLCKLYTDEHAHVCTCTVYTCNLGYVRTCMCTCQFALSACVGHRVKETRPTVVDFNVRNTHPTTHRS